MARPRRLLRVSAFAPDGRRFVVEEVPRGRFPQVRVWDPKERRYQRLTLSLSLRDPQHRPDHLAIREALRLGEAAVMTQLNPGGATAPTMHDLLQYATDPLTGPARSAKSQQDKEWARARRETEAVIDGALPVNQMDGRHLTLVALSALLRTALSLDVHAWSADLVAVRAAVRALDIDAAISALHAAYTCRCGLARKGASEAAQALDSAATRWPELCAQLLRAMCNHASQKHPQRFGPVANLKMEKDQVAQLARTRRVQGIAVPAARPHRPRYGAHDCLALMRLLSDPRCEMQTLLATVSSGDGAYRLTRSLVRIENRVVRIGVDTGGQKRKAINWRPLDADASAAFRGLLATVYASYETEFVSTGADYHFLVGHAWTGEQLITQRDARLPNIAPRYRLLLVLGVERRSEQMLDCWRSHLVPIDDEGHIGLDERTAGTKTAALHMLSPFQERTLGFQMRYGYLAPAEQAYQRAVAEAAAARDAGRGPSAPPPNYPLFPCGRLSQGRATVGPESKPANDRTLDDWNRTLEAALGIAHEAGRALRGWRRAFADLYQSWTRDTALLDRLMDHAKPLHVDGTSTRTRVYLNPADLLTLAAMAELVEYARVEYPRTGQSRRPSA